MRSSVALLRRSLPRRLSARLGLRDAETGGHGHRRQQRRAATRPAPAPPAPAPAPAPATPPAPATRPAPATPTGAGNTSGRHGHDAAPRGTGGPACVSDPTNLVRAGGWICDLTQPYMIQGAWYGYGDGTSCPASTPQPVHERQLLHDGQPRIVDTTYCGWGCGLGMELSARRAARPRPRASTPGSSKCFNITLTGSSGGNVVRIGFSQSPTPAVGRGGAVQGVSRHSRTAGRARSASPTSPAPAGRCRRWRRRPRAPRPARDGTPVDMQIQIAAGSTTTTVGAFNVCISKVEPVGQRQHRHRRLGRRHGELHDTRAAPARITHAIRRRARHVPEGLHRPEQRLGLDRRPDDHVRSRARR